MAIERKKKNIFEVAEGENLFVPKYGDFAKQDPPKIEKEMVQLPPKCDKEPIINVGIMEAEKIDVSFNSDYLCTEIPNINFYGSYSFASENGNIIYDNKQFSTLHFYAKTNNKIVHNTFSIENVMIGIGFHWERLEKQTFEGNLTLRCNNNKILVINNISTEDYLYSVISSEMSATAGLELLKAHAIISRSWLLKPIIEKSITTCNVCETVTEEETIRWYERDSHTLFDVCADDHCQRYQGIARADNENVRSAIEATRGIVLTCDGKICDARFSKSCGGISELFSSCWDNKDEKYLQPIVDSDSEKVMEDLTKEENAVKWILSEHDSFCNTKDVEILSSILNNYDRETTDFYRWKVEYTIDELSEIIKARSGIDFGTITDLIPLQRGPSGRITRLKIIGTKRTHIVGKELEIRKWLSTSHLYSSAFTVTKAEGKFTLIGAGWGHGVGLCQIGAAVMAAKGYKYDSILYHYFKDSELTQLY